MDKIEEEIKKYKDGSLEKGIGLYLLERAKEDLTLASNLAKENKSLSECADYITGEVYKQSITAILDGIMTNCIKWLFTIIRKMK